MDYGDFEKKQDAVEIYCRKLGHNVLFEYCKKESISEPCARVVNCWIAKCNILEYLESKYGAGFVEEFTNRQAKDKMTSIMEIIERAKKRAESQDKP